MRIFGIGLDAEKFHLQPLVSFIFTTTEIHICVTLIKVGDIRQRDLTKQNSFSSSTVGSYVCPYAHIKERKNL